MDTLRDAAAAGFFYSEIPEKLKEEIESAFKNNLGAGLPNLETEKKDLKTKVAILPHAGFAFSGAAASWVYKELAESKMPETIIIIGPAHKPSSEIVSVWVASDWKTPFGLVEINRILGKKIANLDGFGKNPSSHTEEHSIEVQLPFLQYCYRDETKEGRIIKKTKTEYKCPKIVPITISASNDFELAKKLGKEIAEAIKDESVFVIASSDFTHYGFSYGFVPFIGDESKIKEKLNSLDLGAIKQIESLNTEKFIDYIKETGATVCGAMPIAIVMEIAKNLGIKKGNLLKHYNSGDITGDFSSTVGYASILF